MAVDSPLLTRQRVFAAKAEATTGTAESLTATDGAYNVFEPDFTPEITMNDRPGQSALSVLPSVAGTLMGRYTFETELTGDGGSGASGGSWETLLTACGFDESTNTFTPATDATVTLTMASYEDGRRRLLVGAMGTFTMTFTAGNPVRIAWEFAGKLGAHADVAIIEPTRPTLIPPTFKSATLTVGAVAYKISQMTITQNAEVVMREDATDATGIHAAYIVSRGVMVSMDPEAVLHATVDWHAAWRAGTEYALNCVVGSDANNTITITAPKMQIRNNPVGDRNGILVDNLEFQCNRSAAAGDDELQIVLS